MFYLIMLFIWFRIGKGKYKIGSELRKIQGEYNPILIAEDSKLMVEGLKFTEGL